MQFFQYLLLLLQLTYTVFQFAAEVPKKGGILGLSIKGGEITVAGKNGPLSKTDSVQAATTIPAPPAGQQVPTDQSTTPTV